MKLKSTGQKVFLLPSTATSEKPWSEGYTRVTIPYTELETMNARNNKRMHVQIVRDSNLIKEH